MRKMLALLIMGLMLLGSATFAWAEAQNGGGGPSGPPTHGNDTGFIDGTVPIAGKSPVNNQTPSIPTTITIIVNGQKINPDVPAFVDSNNRTQVPYRFVAEALGCTVNWNGSDQSVTAEKNGTKIVLYIGRHAVSVNGAQKTIDTTPILKSNRTFVPIRFLSETLGYSVNWDNATQTVTITG